MIDCDRVRELINLMSDRSIKDHETSKIKALYGDDANNLAISLINRCLFLENLSLLAEISRDSWTIYSYIPNKPKNNRFNILSDGLLNESLIKLVKTQPMKSYLRLSFRQDISFILTKSTSNKPIDIPYLMSYMNELRTSYETLCAEDRLVLKQPFKAGCTINDFATEAYSDASFLVCWTLIEGAKHCIWHKLSPDMPTAKFLDLYQKEISAPVAFSDKVSRRFLLAFLQHLDKFILDRTLASSTGKHTFGIEHDIEIYYKVNGNIISKWFLKNRQNIARLSLVVDNPAECWRNANLKLCSNLAIKYQGSSSPNRDPSFSQTLKSLDTKDWYLNISLLASSARQLEDVSLLYGIQKLADRSIICEYPPLKAMIFNFENHHQKTYDLLKDSKSLDQESLSEFLNACNELNLLELNQDFIDQLETEDIKAIYKNYIGSKSRNEISKTRQDEIECWLHTWSDLNKSNQIEQPTRGYIDILVPTYLNMVVRAPQDDRLKLVERAEWLISQDFIAQCLFPPCFINKNIKVYHVLLELLKGKHDIDQNLIETHAKDLYWNHSLYRHLSDLDMITDLRKHSCKVDYVQLRAAKYNVRNANKTQAFEIAQDLAQRANLNEMKIRSSLLILHDIPFQQNCDQLQKIASQVENYNFEEVTKNDLISKVLRRILRLPFESSNSNHLHIFDDLIEKYVLADATEDTKLGRWQRLSHLSDPTSNAKTLILLSGHLNRQLQTSPNDDKLLIQTFSLDLKLLKNLCQSDLSKHKSSAIDCAARILHQIVNNHSRLDQDDLSEINAVDFIDCTANVWILLKTNLISIISYKDNLASEWREALITIVKHIGQVYPNLLIYSIIVNRLDLQNELVYLNDKSTFHMQDPCLILLQNNCTSDTQESSGKLRDCQRKLTFWNELFDHIKSSTQFENRWHDIVTETEKFLKELRKISFLCGEYLKTLTLKIPKKLDNFIDHFRKLCDTKSGTILSVQRQEECYGRLKTGCDQASKAIKGLLCYSKKIGETNLSKYDIWFCDTFSKHLRELDYRLSLLTKKKPLILDELISLAKSITELLAVCRNILVEHNHLSRQKLYMEMISPLLSRLEPSLIPMPDCCNEPSSSTKPLVFIHKISQTVNLIISKTSPKKLKFIGSDGLSRSFLLKAHEDLRLDQLIMDLFASINNLFLRNERTRNKFRLRRYSVTPVSSRSGLIQWIEAPSICSYYRAWLNGPNGKKVAEDLYMKTCSVLCEDQQSKPQSAHIHCHPPQNIQSIDLFYQLLWAKTKSTRVSLTKAKPFFGNIVKYRAEFDGSVFQSIVEHLTTRMPNDLLTNQLWYMSKNSHSYWLKTQEFICSCAAISIVGYIIGLGDRHPENILLDHRTGEVIHIDYNICFEIGKTLPIPEQVPFRLTPNIIHAFGFGGLEGNFTMSCRNVLDTLKGSKSTILHLLDPINLKFMISQQGKIDDTKDQAARYSSHRIASETTSKAPPKLRRTSEPIKPIYEMDMCSQESVDLRPPVSNMADLLVLNHSQLQERAPAGEQIATKMVIKSQTHHSYDFQHNIKTPTKILEKTATNIYERCRDKLSGTDECIRHYDYRHDASGKQSQQLSCSIGEDTSTSLMEIALDLIRLNDAQTTDDQVDSLIMEATSIKNKSAMFEGWVPWI